MKFIHLKFSWEFSGNLSQDREISPVAFTQDTLLDSKGFWVCWHQNQLLELTKFLFVAASKMSSIQGLTIKFATKIFLSLSWLHWVKLTIGSWFYMCWQQRPKFQRHRSSFWIFIAYFVNIFWFERQNQKWMKKSSRESLFVSLKKLGRQTKTFCR